ncbi:ABC transporter permease [candidate division GN15 bacterium]|uniref:Transport permease protein n=1 Tax=candidate division GN15 bacterium TaxID=2072418 RepID=A0A855X3K9_9BACT|nr:MAG: ABC transporter permease [candidate division GN15 bacterium]
MSFARTYAVFLRQVYLFRGNPTRPASVFLWLVVDIIQWGFISKYLSVIGHARFDFLSAILGAIILWGFVSRVQQGMMTSFLEDVWSQNFINFFASPLKLGEYLSGLALTSIATGLTGFVLGVILAGAAFGFDVFKIGLYLIPFMAILLLFALAMGVFISGVIFRLGPTAEWLGWPIPLVLSIFSGVYYPIATLPTALRLFAQAIPTSYVFESLRGLISTGTFSPDLSRNLVIGGGLALLYLAAAYLFFIRIYRHNLESGAIAKYSAESW